MTQQSSAQWDQISPTPRQEEEALQPNAQGDNSLADSERVHQEEDHQGEVQPTLSEEDPHGMDRQVEEDPQAAEDHSEQEHHPED